MKKEIKLNSLEGKLILLATVLASGMAFLDGTVVNIAVPQIQSSLKASLTDIQWVIDSYALMLAALIMISGSLGDRFGRRKVFSLGILIFLLGSLLCGFSQTTNWLIFSRTFQGLGAAMMIPGSLAIINLCFASSERGKAIGLWSGLAGGISALGPFLGGFIVQTFGWPAIFYINIPIGLLALFFTLKFVPESRNEEATKIDYLGTLTLTLGLLGLCFGLIFGPTRGWSDSTILVSLLLGAFFLIAFFIAERKVKYPMVPFQIFKSPLVLGANLTTLFLYFALYGMIFFIVLNIQQVQGFPPLQAGLSLLPAILIITFLSGWGGSLADKIGPRIPMILGPLIVAIGMALLIIPGVGANYFLYFLPGLILFGLGMSIVIAPLTKSALSVDQKYSGTASGVNNAISRIAALLAIAILGAIALSIFKSDLSGKLNHSSLNPSNRQAIFSQVNSLGAIEVPQAFSQTSKTEASQIIKEAFVTSFRWVMAINVLLVLLGSGISFLMIKNLRK